MTERKTQKGRGLNSIPIRFALMTAAVCAIGFGLQYYLIIRPQRSDISIDSLLIAGLTLLAPPFVTFLAARKLAGMIGALRTSTEAILHGEVDRPVTVDCACEVGGLADSFREMVARFNGNILRMNILAYTDGVTGLPNRAVINHILELADREGPVRSAGSLFFIDLDGFKRINDTFGHDAGDELLRQVSREIIESGFGLRRDDLDNCTTTSGELCKTFPATLVLTRFAGDEFVAVLPGDRPEPELRAFGDAILAALDKPFDILGSEIRIGASVGIAPLHGNGAARESLVHADIAMYRAKELGRNNVVCFDVELKEKIDERAGLEKELHHALDQGDLTLHFQPKICARTLEVSGVEALARWFHPTKGAISPARFIPIAEQTGRMGILGGAVLRSAVMQAGRWGNAGAPLSVAVNVSSIQLERPDFVRSVLELLEREAFDPGLLELEVTESLAMSDYSSARRRLGELRKEGILISIDDFGVGFSNLSQLAQLNFDTLKVDMSLVQGIGRDDKSEAILAAIVSLSHALGCKVVAEGIETMEQMLFLQELKCDQLQGYFFARPMDSEKLRVWLAGRSKNGVSSMQDDLERLLSKRVRAAIV